MGLAQRMGEAGEPRDKQKQGRVGGGDGLLSREGGREEGR